VHLVGFIIRIYHDAWSPEHQFCTEMLHRGLQYNVNDKNSSAEYLTAAALPAINKIYSYTMNQQMHTFQVRHPTLCSRINTIYLIAQSNTTFH